MTRRITDLAYNETQYLDLHLVEKSGQPLVACIHGGGFFAGSKDDERCRQSATLLTEAGFNCASISYSLASREDRFSKWPRNLFDVADALVFLQGQAGKYGYDFKRLGMLGFSAGCCLSNLYIQGGKDIFNHFGYETRVFNPAALAGFYGPYDFSIRQPERRSNDPEINRYHSPCYWLKQNTAAGAPPVLHIQGDQDKVVYPNQHEAFQKDYDERGYDFKAVLVEGFGHSFAPEDSNESGETIDLRSELTDFFSHHLKDGIS
ncbi:MAG: alpha/beta hydrolase [Lysobacterales bacterium]